MSDADEILFVVFWIGVNAIIGYTIGKSKNDVSSCVLLSVLLGPIGWLIALAIKGNVRKCPFCAEQIKSEANICRYCGREVTPTGASKSAIPSVPIKRSRSDVVRDAVILALVALFLVALMLWYAAFKSG
jgi:hypothetical protein